MSFSIEKRQSSICNKLIVVDHKLVIFHQSLLLLLQKNLPKTLSNPPPPPISKIKVASRYLSLTLPYRHKLRNTLAFSASPPVPTLSRRVPNSSQTIESYQQLDRKHEKRQDCL